MKNLLILIITMGFSVHVFSSTASNTVYLDHIILTPKPHVISSTIPNMIPSSDIVISDVEDHSYAAGLNSTAYYDGKSWSSIINQHCLVRPDYPTSGKTTDAWLRCEYGLYHFNSDTKTLSQPIDIDKMLPQLNSEALFFQASGGYLFLFNQTDDGIIYYVIYNPNTKTWSKAQQINGNYKGYLMYGNSASDSYPPTAKDDDHPRILLNLYLWYGENYLKLKQLQINSDGSYYFIPELETGKYHVNKYAPPLMEGTKSYTILQDAQGVYYLLYSTGITSSDWHIIKLPNGADYNYFRLVQNDIRDGNLCELFSGNNDNSMVSCININNQNPSWSPEIKITDTIDLTYALSSLQTRDDGAWISYSMIPGSGEFFAPDVFDYNSKTKSIVDTKFPEVSSGNQMVIMQSIGDNTVLACVGDTSNYSHTPAEFYLYDNTSNSKKWIKLNNPQKSIYSCRMSNSAVDDYHNFWVFNGDQKK